MHRISPPGVLRTGIDACFLGAMDNPSRDILTRADYMGASGFEKAEFNVMQGFWPWEVDAVNATFAGLATVLVAGVGGGREAIALARSGFEVTAFDGSSDLVAACRNNARLAGVHVDVREAAQSDVPRDLGTYDALLIGRGFYHHVPGRRQRIALLRRCREHVDVGAPMILGDFHVRPECSSIHHSIWRIAECVRQLRGSNDAVEVGDYLTGSFQHAFVRGEIEAELAASGFGLVEWRVSPLSQGSTLAHVLARACPF